MDKTTKYTRIIFNRTHLFEVCRYGFMAQSIGDLWCDGWIKSEELHNLSQKKIDYRTE